MKKGLVSICIPVYNGAKTIKMTIDSVLEQSYSDFELIIVDNCSTDETVDIVKSYTDERIKLFCNDSNLGMAGNWNKCLEYVQGEYLQYLCADDTIFSECIKEKVSMMNREEDIILVTSASYLINDKDTVLMERHFHHGDCLLNGKKMAKRSFYTRNLFGEPSNILCRSNAIVDKEKFAMNTCYATDWDMWMRLASKGKVAYIDKILMQYRVSTSNETSRLNIKKYLKDDKALVENIVGYECFELNGWDIFIHRIMCFLRMLARGTYMKYVAKRS